MNLQENEYTEDIAEVFTRKAKYETIAKDLLVKEGYTEISVIGLEFFISSISISVLCRLGLNYHKRKIYVNLPCDILNRSSVEYELLSKATVVTRPF